MTPGFHTRSEAGFSLAETLVALFITAVGTLSVATLIGYGTKLQTTARDATIAASAGRQELERLRLADPLAAKRTVGGSLTANVANHSTTSTVQGQTYRIRWAIVAGPASTKEVTMVVLPQDNNWPLATLGARLWP